LPLSVAVSGSVAVPVSVAVGEQRGVAGEGAGGAQPSPPAPADISGEPTTATANGAEPDLRSAIDHDPGNEIDVAIVAFCVRMAKVEAWREDRQPRAADALRILEAVSATPAGVTLSGLRNASAAWKEQTWRACELFEQDARGEGEQPP
jgi:hypothetical protein